MLLSTFLRIAVTVCTAVTAAASPLASTDSSLTSWPGIQSTFEWHSSGALVFPKNDSRAYAGVKDPSIVEINGVYHVFASVVNNTNGGSYSLVYFNFTDFNKANEAHFNYLDTYLGSGYLAAPEVFYFEPHKLWYLVFQNGNAAWSTNKNIGNPTGWTTPSVFYPDGTPALIAPNVSPDGPGYWVDMWVICDNKKCHLFSSDDRGHLYRSDTSIKNFPNNMSQPVIALEYPEPDELYEASNVYHIGNKKYLLIVEAIGNNTNRYFRSWTSNSIEGQWKELAATEQHPFARSNNVFFNPQKAWTQDISHGEVIRTQLDQTLSIEPCRLRYLYQGLDPAYANLTYNLLPWRLGLLTQTNSIC